MITVLSNVAGDLCLVLPLSLYAWAQLLVLAGERMDEAGAPRWLRMLLGLRVWRGSPRLSRNSSSLAQACWWLIWIAFVNFFPVGVVVAAPFGHFPAEQPTLAAVVVVSIAALALEAWLVAPAWLRLYRRRQHPGST